MTSVLIIVVNWNGIKDTEKCLSSLFEQTYKNFEVLVVDNGSTNNSLKRLRVLEKEHERLTVIDNVINSGFTGGVNAGIRYALEKKFDAIALFNNDAVADKEWLTELVEASKPNSVGIATGLLLHGDGKTIDSSGDFYSTWGVAYPRNRDYKAETAPESGYVFGASGGASLYKASLFKDIGLFDTSFFMYYEDVDISFRAQLAGWKVAYTKKAIAYHNQGASAKKVPGLAVSRFFANIPQLFIKNVPRGLLWHIGVRFYLAYFLMFWNAVFKGRGGPAVRGALRSIILAPGSLVKRHRIQSTRKVSAEYIHNVIWNDLPPDQTGMRRFRKFFTGKS